MKRESKKVVKFVASFILLVLLSVLFIFLKTQYEYYSYSPYDVIISDITPNSAIVSWKTERRVPSYILFNDEFLGSGEYETFHRVEISNLQPDFDYTFLISNGKKTWSESKRTNSLEIEPFLAKEFKFNTKEIKHDIYLPVHEVLSVLPNELTYVVLFDQESKTYSEIKSKYSNRFGGVVFDKAGFENSNPLTSVVEDINYFGRGTSTSSKQIVSLVSRVYAIDEINCNQKIPEQKSNAVGREAYADIANKWGGNKGKNYAYECYNDVVYRAKRAGIDPGFALAVWLKESGASNYTLIPRFYGIIEDFGIHNNKSAPPQDFDAQITYFLKLKHSASCPGLTPWESWGNNYRTGSCNTNDPVRRQIGIDYYRDVERIYKWITNGKSLPSKVKGLEPIAPIQEELEPKCCALKIDNSENFFGNYHYLTNGRSCEQLWKHSTDVFGGNLQYSVMMESKQNELACEIEYSGVCCNMGNKILWYPEEICEQVVKGIQDFKSCNEYVGESACYFRDAKYMWLPIVIGDDFEEGVSSESSCEERNIVEGYNIKLYKGINFVGFDFYPLYHNRELLGSELLEMYPEIMLIANFKEFEWQDIIVRTETIPFAGNDFNLEQNKGYLITVEEDITISLEGWKDSSLEYENTNGGWILVGGNLYTSSGWASRLIANLKENDIDVKTVAIWSNDVGYFYYRREDGEEIYGEDVKLEDTKGVFIKSM